MTISKKLYMNFGIILVMVVALFLANWLAVRREHDAKKGAQQSQDLDEATKAVRSQMMQNSLYLSNYLLSGDTREVDRMNDGLRTLNEKLEKGRLLASSERAKESLEKFEQLEQAWGKEFAQPLIEKRKDVDSGNATVAELQIYYLQKDYGRALSDIREVLSREPRHFGALSGLGLILQEIGDEKHALEAYRRALAIDPHLENVEDAIKKNNAAGGGGFFQVSPH